MAIGIGRRQFTSALVGAAVWPLAARAQQLGKLPTIGVLGADATVWSPWTAAFVARLSELGWTEGRTVAIEYRWSEGRPERVAKSTPQIFLVDDQPARFRAGPRRAQRQAPAGLRNLRRGEGANPLNPRRKHFLDNANAR
jgi:hypothetical protein